MCPFMNSVFQHWPQCLKKRGKVEHHFLTEFYRRDVTVQELAEVNDTPASTIYKILSRARNSLRRCVRRTIAESTFSA